MFKEGGKFPGVQDIDFDFGTKKQYRVGGIEELGGLEVTSPGLSQKG